MILRAEISALMWPMLNSAFGDFDTYPAEWKEIFDTHPSNMAQEMDVELKFFNVASIKPEGSPFQMDSARQAVLSTYIHRTICNGFAISAEAIEDNQYPNQFPQKTQGLRNSINEAQNILGANVLNQGFNTAFATGDGQPVFSTTHPIEGGVYANTFSGGAIVDLSLGSLEQAIILIQKFPAQSGLLAHVKPEMGIVAPAQQFTMSRLLNSSFDPETANNGINPINHDNYLPKGYRVNHFLTSPNAWFIKTNADNGFKYFERSKIQTDSYVDFNTNTVANKAWLRGSFGISNCRAAFGSPGV